MLSKTHKTKRFLPMILTAAATALGIMLFSHAVSAGTYGAFEYTVEGGEATITKFNGSGAVTVPAEIDGYPVTRIENNAFQWNIAAHASITSVVIPDSVRTIGGYAFLGCSNLESVTFGDGVETIGDEAFMSCSSLRTLNFGCGLRSIGMGAFSDCDSITEFVIPDSVEYCGDCAFANCASLGKVTIGSGVTGFGTGCFESCPMNDGLTLSPENDSFVIIDGVLYDKNVADLIWCPMSKTEISIPDSVTKIHGGAFVCCDKIRDLKIPDGITEIGESAFSECHSLKNLVIPDSVTNVGNGAFAVSSVSGVTIGKGVRKLSNSIFFKCELLSEVTVPDQVTEIDDYAFKECSSLKRVTIGGGVRSMGTEVFVNCDRLTDIYFVGTSEKWEKISENAGIPESVTVRFVDKSPDSPDGSGDSDVIDVPPDSPGGSGDSDDKPAVKPIRFSDVPRGSYYEDAVSWAVLKEITAGVGGGRFSPGSGCTRGQVVTFMWRAAGSPEPNGNKNPFFDVKADDYYCKAVLWAVENGVTAGTGKKTFSPDFTCTRGQIVTFLYRANGSPEMRNMKNPFVDVKEDGYYRNAVLWAVDKGVTAGTGKTTFSPESTCTRAQVVTFLYRDAVQ